MIDFLQDCFESIGRFLKWPILILTFAYAVYGLFTGLGSVPLAFESLYRFDFELLALTLGFLFLLSVILCCLLPLAYVIHHAYLTYISPRPIIFISYHHSRSVAAEAIASYLAEQQYDVRYLRFDEALSHEEVLKFFYENIEDCSLVVCLPSSVPSFVDSEVAVATGSQKPLLFIVDRHSPVIPNTAARSYPCIDKDNVLKGKEFGTLLSWLFPKKVDEIYSGGPLLFGDDYPINEQSEYIQRTVSLANSEFVYIAFTVIPFILLFAYPMVYLWYQELFSTSKFGYFGYRGALLLVLLIPLMLVLPIFAFIFAIDNIIGYMYKVRSKKCFREAVFDGATSYSRLGKTISRWKGRKFFERVFVAERPTPVHELSSLREPDVETPKRNYPSTRNKLIVSFGASVVLAVAMVAVMRLHPGKVTENITEERPAYMVGEEIIECAGCPKVIVLPSGEFFMGADSGPSFVRPRRLVQLSAAFAIGAAEITNDEFNMYLTETSEESLTSNTGEGGSNPVRSVSWKEAVAYSEWLSKKTGSKYRLPSEAEWEYAARAHSETSYWWGDEIGVDNANCAQCLSASAEEVEERRTHEAETQDKLLELFDGVFAEDPEWLAESRPPVVYSTYESVSKVKSHKPNQFGLFDTAGNVAEHVLDCWHGSYRGAPSDGSPWMEEGLLGIFGYKCKKGIVRGGSFSLPSQFATSFFRGSFGRSESADNVGFRIAREIN